MIYKFKCESCSLQIEIVETASTMKFDDRECPRCSGASKHVFEGAPAVATSGMSNSPLDVAVGKDAEKRWSDIYRKQEVRDKIRKETGEKALRINSKNEFAPLPGARLETVTIPQNTPVSG